MRTNCTLLSLAICGCSFCLLTSCRSLRDRSSDPSHIRCASGHQIAVINSIYLDEDGHVVDFRLEQMKPILGKSSEYALGSLLGMARKLHPKLAIDITLLLRDTRPCVTPISRRLDSNQLLAICTNAGDPLANGLCYVDVSNMRLTDALSLIHI